MPTDSTPTSRPVDPGLSAETSSDSRSAAPIDIPKLYDGHNKTFFFASYEDFRDSNAGSYTGTMPTALERKGDFSRTTDANGNLIVIYDPSTTGRIPRRRPEPPGTSAALLQATWSPPTRSIDRYQSLLLPRSESGGVGKSNTSNSSSNAPGKNNNNRIDARFDHQFNDHQSAFAHFDWFSNWIYQNNYYGNGLSPVMSNDRIPGFNIAGHHTWSIFRRAGSGANASRGRTASPTAPSLPMSRRPLWDLRPVPCPE